MLPTKQTHQIPKQKFKSEIGRRVVHCMSPNIGIKSVP